MQVAGPWGAWPACPPNLGPMPPRPWSRSVTPVAPPASASPTLRNLVYAGTVTGIWASVICLAVYGIGRAAGVPFEVSLPGATGLVVVPWYLVAVEPLVAGLIAALLSSLLLGRRHVRRLVYWVGTLIALLSLVSPLTQPDSVIWSTRIWLCVLHVITWWFIVPQLARIAGDSEPVAA